MSSTSGSTRDSPDYRKKSSVDLWIRIAIVIDVGAGAIMSFTTADVRRTQGVRQIHRLGVAAEGTGQITLVSRWGALFAIALIDTSIIGAAQLVSPVRSATRWV
jgi:hypothetical protein